MAARATQLLTSSVTGPARQEILAGLASGKVQVVVGTHALVEETVSFKQLGLAIVDEQHRFGVRQRAALDAKAPEGLVPHALHMTATPIPRTLSLTATATSTRRCCASCRAAGSRSDPRRRRRPRAGARVRAHP